MKSENLIVADRGQDVEIIRENMMQMFNFMEMKL
jgi:hypothetical protein